MNNLPNVIMDADWATATDDEEDLIYDHLRKLDEMHHDDHATPDDLIRRIRTARKYIRRSCRRYRARSRKLTACIQRLLIGSILFLAWAVLLALLVG